MWWDRFKALEEEPFNSELIQKDIQAQVDSLCYGQNALQHGVALLPDEIKKAKRLVSARWHSDKHLVPPMNPVGLCDTIFKMVQTAFNKHEEPTVWVPDPE